MREKAKELLNLPVKSGDLDDLETLRDVEGANVTVESAVLLKQIQQAMHGNPDAALFLKEVIGEETEESEDTAISEAAQEGDTLKMLKAMRDKLSTLIDRSTNPREVSSITRQLLEVNDRIEEIERNQRNKQGENPLNVILLNSARKRKKAVNE